MRVPGGGGGGEGGRRGSIATSKGNQTKDRLDTLGHPGPAPHGGQRRGQAMGAKCWARQLKTRLRSQRGSFKLNQMRSKAAPNSRWPSRHPRARGPRKSWTVREFPGFPTSPGFHIQRATCPHCPAPRESVQPGTERADRQLQAFRIFLLLWLGLQPAGETTFLKHTEF